MALWIIAWHDRPLEDHRQLEQTNFSQGFRTISLSVYGERTDPRYAAVMIKRQQPIVQVQFNSLNLDAWQQTFNDMAAQGLGPVIVTATGPPDDPIIAAVFQPLQSIPFTRHGITEQELRQINENSIEDPNPMNRQILQWADSYGTPDNIRYIAVWFPSPNLLPWNSDSLNADGFTNQRRFDALVSAGARPYHIAITPSQGFLEAYVDNQIGRWASRSGMSNSQYQTEFNNLMAQGLAPVRVAAQGSGADARFAAIFADAEDVEARQFGTTGSPSVPSIDNAVEDVMKKTQTRGAALAIVEGTRLVYVKGYTWAEIDYPTVEPTTFFRQASVSKMFAALATYQLVKEGRLSLDDKMQDILQLRTPAGQQPTDPNFNNITIRHLLEYKSGLDPDLLGRNLAATVAFNAQLPATPIQLASFAASENLVSTPGALNDASDNAGYFMLSQVIARLRGASSFEAAIAPTLLQPLGITRVREAKTLLNSQLPGEARYHRYRLETGHNSIDGEGSVMSSDRPLVPMGYGEDNWENFDGSGGLSAAVTDVARILACFSLRNGNPILDRNTLHMMFNNAATGGHHGFDWVQIIDDANMIYHGVKGGLLSTSSNGINFRTGGLSYVICWNWQAPAPLYLSTSAENWYPEFWSVLDAARAKDWGNIDLFPQYGMVPF